MNNHIIYRMAEAIAKELATFHGPNVCAMAVDIANDQPCDLTPFNCMAVSALKVVRDLVKMTPNGVSSDDEILNEYIDKALKDF